MNTTISDNSLTIRDNAFRFKREANFSERQRIKALQAEYAGGFDKLTELDALTSTLYIKHKNYNIQKYGKEKIEEIELLFKKNIEDCTAEEIAIRVEYNNNPFNLQLMDVIDEKDFIHGVANLIVLCTHKPEGYEFNNQADEELRKLIQEVKEANKSFRTGEATAL